MLRMRIHRSNRKDCLTYWIPLNNSRLRMCGNVARTSFLTKRACAFSPVGVALEAVNELGTRGRLTPCPQFVHSFFSPALNVRSIDQSTRIAFVGSVRIARIAGGKLP